jgi:hypothetical protein
MTDRQLSEILSTREEIVDAPVQRACVDQSFELPAGVYAAMASLFAGFIGVLAFSFRSQMAVSYAVVFLFLGAFFAIPLIFTKTPPADSRKKALSWDMFRYKGIAADGGHMTAKEATVLVLLLPFLIFCFGVAIAIIAALT